MPSEKRILAGRRNRQLRGELTPQGREKLRKCALEHQPWRFSTGPTSPEGKKKASLNGKVRQSGPKSVREVKAETSVLWFLIEEMKNHS